MLQPLQESTYRSWCSLLGRTLTYNLSTVYFAFIICYFNCISYDTIAKIYHIQYDASIAEGVLSGCPCVGAGAGCLLAEWLLGRMSRWNVFLVLNVCAGVGGLIVFIDDGVALLVGRLVQGLCAGMTTGVVPLMVNQLMPKEVSHWFGSVMNVCFAAGGFLPFFLSFLGSLLFESDDYYWFIIFAFPFLLTFTQQTLLFLVYTHQTPKYLLVNDRDREAKELIAEIYLPEYHEQIYEEKLRDLSIQTQHRTYAKDSCMAKFVAFAILILSQTTGIMIIILYTGDVSEKIFPGMAKLFPLLLLLVKLLLSFFGTFIVVWFDHRRLMLFGSACLSVCLTLIFFGLQDDDETLGMVLLLCGYFGFIISFITSIGSVIFFYVAQIVQPRILTYAYIAYWLSSAVLLAVFPVIRANSADGKGSWMFLFCAANAIAMFVICFKFMVGTRNRTEKQIRSEFEKL